MKAGFSIKLLIIFCAELSATNCRAELSNAELSAPNCPRRIVLRRIVRTPRQAGLRSTAHKPTSAVYSYIVLALHQLNVILHKPVLLPMSNDNVAMVLYTPVGNYEI